MLPLPCMLVCRSCYAQNRTRDRGCSKHPVFPAPSDFRARSIRQTSGETGREIAASHSTVIARLDRAIQYSRDANDQIDKPRRTGSPALAGYDDRAALQLTALWITSLRSQ